MIYVDRQKGLKTAFLCWRRKVNYQRNYEIFSGKWALLSAERVIVVVQFSSCVQLFATPWNAAYQASLSFTIFQSLLKFMSIELVMPSNRFVLCCSLLLLPSVFPSIRIFFNGSVLSIRWPKWVSASASVRPMNIQDWFPLGLTGWISLQSKGLSRVFFTTRVQKPPFIGAQLSL